MNISQIRDTTEIHEHEIEEAKDAGLLVHTEIEYEFGGRQVKRHFAAHPHFVINYVENGGLWSCMS